MHAMAPQGAPHRGWGSIRVAGAIAAEGFVGLVTPTRTSQTVQIGAGVYNLRSEDYFFKTILAHFGLEMSFNPLIRCPQRPKQPHAGHQRPQVRSPTFQDVPFARPLQACWTQLAVTKGGFAPFLGLAVGHFVAHLGPRGPVLSHFEQW